MNMNEVTSNKQSKNNEKWKMCFFSLSLARPACSPTNHLLELKDHIIISISCGWSVFNERMNWYKMYTPSAYFTYNIVQVVLYNPYCQDNWFSLFFFLILNTFRTQDIHINVYMCTIVWLIAAEKKKKRRKNVSTRG